MKGSRTLIFFSTQYPYETTLKNEFTVLSRHFQTIYYFPASINQGEAWVPENVKVLDDLSKANLKKPWSFLFNHFFYVAVFFLNEALRKGNFLAYLKHAKVYIRYFLDNLHKSDILRKYFSDEILKNALFYDYWFQDSTLALAILKQKKIINHAICRAHRFDLYDVQESKWMVPFRHFICRNIDNVFPVSMHGLNYLSAKEPDYKEKFRLHYLGVSNHNFVSLPGSKLQKHLILSCSNFRHFKRVHVIPDVLKNLNLPVHWVHFGTGDFFDETQKKIKELPENISCDLKGNVPNKEVLEFYLNNSVSVFLSLSVSEGLPISMMEAVSYGVPVAAMSVCGIPELVDNRSGVLFSLNDDVKEITDKLRNFLLNNPASERQNVKKVFTERFDIDTNLEKFAIEIQNV